MLSRLCEEGLATSLTDAARQPLALALHVLEYRAMSKVWAKKQQGTALGQDDRGWGDVLDHLERQAFLAGEED